MILAAAPVLGDNPTSLAVAQITLAVVAIASFYWASRYAHSSKSTDTQRRVDKVESQVGAVRVCNPGRRSTDRCILCPLDDRCERYPKLARTPDELKRDTELVDLMRVRQETLRSPGTVVVVEDHEVVLAVTQSLLEQAGIKTRGARTIKDALPFTVDDDVLVADWNLPDGTALDVISAFHAVTPDGPVVLTSALDVRPEAVPEDAVWMSKPYDPDFFIAVVRKMLARK